ncbi:hydrogenase maturation peptidase HycI [Raoultibacter massiliensis]|uniref:Hydrogenase maturation peptidase HycI n=1 Tax=Raoultibacter massiliensis TaxID=1852371 RepID=A0ABV1JGJ3_9ACTN|nr:hydrogenase maturation peptidase HycI [Raoultibacter massiliensis]
MTDKVLLTVGSVLRGDDAAGPMLAKLMSEHPEAGWAVVDGGQTPEDELQAIRRIAPKTVVVVDAAHMGLDTGAIRRLKAEDVARSFLITTHALPLTFLLGQLGELAEVVIFLGIQPADTTFFNPLTPAVKESVEELCGRLVSGADLMEYPAFEKTKQ